MKYPAAGLYGVPTNDSGGVDGIDYQHGRSFAAKTESIAYVFTEIVVNGFRIYRTGRIEAVYFLLFNVFPEMSDQLSVRGIFRGIIPVIRQPVIGNTIHGCIAVCINLQGSFASGFSQIYVLVPYRGLLSKHGNVRGILSIQAECHH